MRGAAASRTGAKTRLNSDLLQHADIGLLKAAGFDPDKGFRFSTPLLADRAEIRTNRSGLVPRKASQFSIRRKLFYNLTPRNPTGRAEFPQTPL
jgi:hypothetical protein